MKSMLVTGFVGIVLFAGSAAVSWFLMDKKKENSAEVAEAEKGNDKSEHGVVNEPPVLGDGAEKKEQLPVAIRPDTPLSVEAVLELSESIKRKERDLVEREKSVEKAEQNIKVMFDDLRVERAELLTVMDGIESKIQTAKASLAELKQENQSISTQKQELEKLKSPKSKGKKGEPEIDEVAEKAKTIKGWIENLEPEKAAELVKEYANSGNLPDVIQLLKKLPPGTSGKILDAIDDTVLVRQIIDAASAEGDAGDADPGAATSDAKALDR